MRARKIVAPDGQRLGVEARSTTSSGRPTISQTTAKNFCSSAPTVRWLPVGAGVDVVARVAAVQEHALPLGHDARGEVVAEVHREEGEGAVGHGHVDVLALAGARGAEEGREQADHPEQRSAAEIGDLDAGDRRAAVVVRPVIERRPARPM